MGAVVTLDDVVTMLLAEAVLKRALAWRPCLGDARVALLLSLSCSIAMGASTETQRRAERAGWVYR